MEKALLPTGRFVLSSWSSWGAGSAGSAIVGVANSKEEADAHAQAPYVGHGQGGHSYSTEFVWNPLLVEGMEVGTLKATVRRAVPLVDMASPLELYISCGWVDRYYVDVWDLGSDVQRTENRRPRALGPWFFKIFGSDFFTCEEGVEMRLTLGKLSKPGGGCELFANSKYGQFTLSTHEARKLARDGKIKNGNPLAMEAINS